MSPRFTRHICLADAFRGHFHFKVGVATRLALMNILTKPKSELLSKENVGFSFIYGFANVVVVVLLLPRTDGAESLFSFRLPSRNDDKLNKGDNQDIKKSEKKKGSKTHTWMSSLGRTNVSIVLIGIFKQMAATQF